MAFDQAIILRSFSIGPCFACHVPKLFAIFDAFNAKERGATGFGNG